MTRKRAGRAGGWALVLALLSGAWSGAAAQSLAVRGLVKDETTGRPMVGAVVRLAAGDRERVTRSDETGGFVFAPVVPGTYALDVRRLGYQQVRLAIEVRGDMAPLDVRMTRVATLDTVRVRASRQGLFGVVAAAHDLRPLPSATVQIIGTAAERLPVDSAGWFFMPVKAIGTYVLRAKAPGFDAQTVSVIVNPNEGVEVAFVLDSALAGPSYRLDMAYQDFDDRVKQRGLASAVVPRSELLQHGDGSLLNALIYARSFTKRVLRFGWTACVFVDGRPQPMLSLNAIDPADVEAVEVYGAGAERTGTLSRAWPKGMPCGYTGFPRTAPGRDVVSWVSIWLKH